MEEVSAFENHYFEGVEKLLEIWFTQTESNPTGDLRNIPREKLERLLKTVRCGVISFSSNDEIDAYVLSESSLFVAKRRFILKTCGTTTPLMCLKSLLMLVEQYAGFTSVEDLFYSRKNFKRPELQKSVHRSFDQEVKYLNALFKNGVAYTMGTNDFGCQWYLYTLKPLSSSNSNINGNPVGLSPKKKLNKDVAGDQTLEILMTDLDPEIMSIFTKSASSSALEATEKSGIDKIIPNMEIDAYLFEPCGYSMNGISKDGYYMTIHITPEPDFSYVSFETNVQQASYNEIIALVLETFQPAQFVCTVFASKKSAALGSIREMKYMKEVGKWSQQEIEFCSLKNYDLTYTFYSKFPS
ncbi:unnamed protein product [Bemisia tabaci]|uniref:S-adenosylmethionine decarboxylase proenzyme n=1 Tax=Bemisia tabaci TaxID=7038 RepID=A0A9P0AJ86_BEMTA|nr:unnamed protein product [Bemisia tabaci]